MTDSSKEFFILLAVLTLLAACFRLYGIMEQTPLTDEIHMAYTAEGYVERGHFVPSMPHHPNLRNILVFLSIKIFGFNGLGLRFFSILFGTASVPLLGLFVHRLTSNRDAAGLAAFLLAVDPVHITFSRQPIQEVHIAFFCLLGFTLLLRSRERFEKPGGPSAALLLLPAAGIAFGLGIASKYNTAFVLLVGVGLAVRWSWRAGRTDLTALAVVSLVIVPAMVLLLTDAPWFGRGYDLGDWLFMRKANLERMTTKYVPALMEMNPDTSAWQWFLKPFTGYSNFVVAEGSTHVTVGLSNPLDWLLVIPASVYLLVKRSLRGSAALLQALFWLSYVPFLVTQRPIWIVSAMAVVPYAFGLLGLALADILAERRTALRAYVAAVLCVSILLFPMTMGRSLDHSYTSLLAERFRPH
jgi:4-amino-4-deoxy-L-arabinose transferase-like glycosyltransferase